MSKGRDRIVYKSGISGLWVQERIDAPDAPRIEYVTQYEAICAAKEFLLKEGGGELIVKGVDGKIRSKDTIGDGNESPKKDKER